MVPPASMRQEQHRSLAISLIIELDPVDSCRWHSPSLPPKCFQFDSAIPSEVNPLLCEGTLISFWNCPADSVREASSRGLSRSLTSGSAGSRYDREPRAFCCCRSSQ